LEEIAWNCDGFINYHEQRYAFERKGMADALSLGEPFPKNGKHNQLE